MTSTHYEVLGVPSGSSTEEIRLAYLRKARATHPDTATTADPARVRERQVAMVALNAAWFVLRDPDRRRLYDLELERAREQREWEQPEPDDEWVPVTEQPYDFSGDGWVIPPEYGAHGRHPAASIARLYVVVMAAVFVLLAIAFTYAVIRSGTVGVNLPQ